MTHWLQRLADRLFRGGFTVAELESMTWNEVYACGTQAAYAWLMLREKRSRIAMRAKLREEQAS